MRNTIIIGIATVVLSVALIPTASAGGSQYGPLDPWMQNLIARNAATGTDTALDPWMQNLIARHAYRKAAPATTGTVAGDNSGWNTAGIGLGAGIGVLLVVAAMVARVRRSRQRLAHS
jgi:hypothetical protein